MRARIQTMERLYNNPNGNVVDNSDNIPNQKDFKPVNSNFSVMYGTLASKIYNIKETNLNTIGKPEYMVVNNNYNVFKSCIEEILEG